MIWQQLFLHFGVLELQFLTLLRVVLLFLADENRKLHRSGCIKGTMVIRQQLFFHFGTADVP